MEWWFEHLGIERLRRAIGTQGEGATVGIWDTGLDLVWGAVTGSRMAGANFLEGEAEDFSDTSLGQHGSDIARLIAGNADRFGVAPKANVVIARAAGDRGEKYSLKPFEQGGLFKDTDVINVSYSYRSDIASHAAAITDFNTMLKGSDKLIVAAMGNYSSGLNAGVVVYPASTHGAQIIGVNAHLRDGSLYAGSMNRPGVVDICAPGHAIPSHFGSGELVGTSFACAIVSGVCCLIYSALRKRNITATAAAVSAILLNATDSHGDSGAWGRGTINTDKLINAIVK